MAQRARFTRWPAITGRSTTRTRTVDGHLRRGFRAVWAGIALMALAGVLAVAYDSFVATPHARRLSSAERTLLSIHGAMVDQETGLRGWLLTGDQVFLQPYQSGKVELPKDDAELAAELKGDGLKGDGAPALAAFEQAQRTWVDEWAVAAEQRGAVPAASSETNSFSLWGKALFDHYRAAEAALAAVIEADHTAASQQVTTAGYVALAAELLAGALALVVSSRQRRRLSATLADPARQVAAVIERIAGGDHDARAPRVAVQELDVISLQLNRMAAEIAQQQRTLVDAERRARQLGELCPDGVAVMDGGGALTYVNPAMATMLGYGDPADLIGAPVSQFRSGEEGMEVARLRHAAVFDGTPVRGAHEQVRKQDGTMLEVDIHSVSCEIDGGAGVLSVVRDATEQRRTETMLRDAADKERQASAALRAVDQARAELLATVSHELRTPLTSIIGYVEMLADGDAGDVNEEQHDMLDAVERNGRRLLRLVEDLLAQSRLDAGKFRLDLQPVDVGELLARCAEAIGPLADNRGQHFTVTDGAGGEVVAGDANALERVLLNLLSNAVKFTPESGHITLEADTEEEQVVIMVTDDGMGIPAEEQAHLFERFFRSSTSQEQFIEGTGLGLAIAKSIIDEHGGRIAVASSPEQGTRFRVTLPRVGGMVDVLMADDAPEDAELVAP